MANEQLQSTIESLHERRRKRERMTRIGWIVAGVCALILLACLMVPAFTMEHNKYDCGLEEHAHTDKCYANEVVCGFPTEKAHVHTPSCYNKSNVLTCKKDEAGHIHLAACYDKNDKLTCDKEETVHIHKASCFDKNGKNVCKNKDALHVHGDTCYTEVKSADEKSSSKDSDDDKATEATTTPVAYKLTCTEESVGHVHRDACYNDKGKLICGKDEVIEIPHKHDDSCYEKVLACGQEEHTHTDECLKEEAPIEVEDEGIDQIEAGEAEAGADGDAVEGDAAEGDVEGDADGTEAEPSDAAEPDLTDQEIADAEDQGLFYENKDMMVAFTVPDEIKDSIKLKVTETNDEVVPYTEQDLSEFAEASVEAGKVVDESDGSENAAATDEGTEATTNDGEQGTDSQASDAAAPQAKTTQSDEQPEYQINLHVEATLNDQPVEDIASLGITAKLQMKPKVISPILKEINYKEVAPEIKSEVGAEITVIQHPEVPANAMLSDVPDAYINEVVVANVKHAAMSIDLQDANLEITAGGSQNANFKVTYSAYVDTVLTAEEAKKSNEFKGAEIKSVDLIDTDKNGGLPKNGKNNAKSNMGVYKIPGTTDWAVTAIKESKPVYQDKTFKYFEAPNLTYFNILAENKGYKIKDIVVKHSCDNAAVTTKIEGDNQINNAHFTNNPERVSEGYILIDNDTVIAINYECQNFSPDFKATMYDYDITSQNADGTYNSVEQGINSKSNYANDGKAKFAFGNDNSKTGLSEETLNGNYFNRANNTTDGGCHFGLVKDELGDKGQIQFHEGLDVPSIFDNKAPGTTIGKTTYEDYQLVFDQDGDTYTLTSVNNGSGKQVIGNLGQFKSRPNWNNTLTIFSNDFWALDGCASHGTSGHDPLFGDAGLTTSNGGYLPVSDFGGNHDAYYGLQYEVGFDLIKDYVGPLNYYFFGDDDMWVYLDGKLVCDIGGVHSSYGEYVNLWNYVGDSYDGNSTNGKCGDGKHHTLKFYFSERGAAGSTCYMRFTLPEVTSAKRSNTASLRIEKQIEGNVYNDTQDFSFDISLKDANGNPLPDNYSYSTYNHENVIVGEPDLIFPSKTTIKLKAGQYIVVKYLPEGTQYEISEQTYEPDISINGNAIEGLVANRTVNVGNQDSVLFVNQKYILPDTGGVGAHWYWMAGGTLLIISVGTLIWRRRTSAKQAQ